jgi:hypothetical protein
VFILPEFFDCRIVLVDRQSDSFRDFFVEFWTRRLGCVLFAKNTFARLPRRLLRLLFFSGIFFVFPTLFVAPVSFTK